MFISIGLFEKIMGVLGISETLAPQSQFTFLVTNNLKFLEKKTEFKVNLAFFNKTTKL